MVPRATRAKLPPSCIFSLTRNAGQIPVAVHHGMRLGRAMLYADAELRPTVKRFFVTIELLRDGFNWPIEHRKLHSAGDIHANCVRNHRVVTSQHTTDWQPITDVRVRHQRSANCIRNLTGNAHLLVGTGIDIGTPSLITYRLVTNWQRLCHQFPSKLTPNRVCLVGPWIAYNSRHNLPRPLPLHPHPRALLRSTRQRLNCCLRTIRRHTKFLKLLAIHNWSDNWTDNRI